MKHVSYTALIAGIAGAIYFGLTGDYQHAGECLTGIVLLFTTAPHKVGAGQ